MTPEEQKHEMRQYVFTKTSAELVPILVRLENEIEKCTEYNIKTRRLWDFYAITYARMNTTDRKSLKNTWNNTIAKVKSLKNINNS